MRINDANTSRVHYIRLVLAFDVGHDLNLGKHFDFNWFRIHIIAKFDLCCTRSLIDNAHSWAALDRSYYLTPIANFADDIAAHK